MVGHIAGLGYSQRVDVDGHPLVGAKLYIYQSGTSTPVTVYQDYANTIEHTHPIVADAAGIIPMFWVPDGTYRVRLTDADGVEIFDDDGIVALGPSSGSASAGSSVDATSVAQTGDFLWLPIAGARTGWVRGNGRTIGSAASGGTERANSDCEDLFLFLWNNYSNSLAPVTGGRGGSAAADWAANKVIATIDMRSKGNLGLDDMGNSAAGVTGGSTSAGAAVGASTYTLAQNQLPNVSLTHALTISKASTVELLTGSTLAKFTINAGGSGAGVPESGGALVSTILASSVVSGTISLSTAGGVDIDILSPVRVGTWYIKL